MDENYDRNFKANEYLDRKEDIKQERKALVEVWAMEVWVWLILFVAGCVCGALLF